jgi:ketosteroid isomerase-like protein
MSTRSIVEIYYKLANAGDWDAWCDLFAPEQVMDEQLAGHIEGRDALRGLMKGFPAMYARFANVPRLMVVEGDEAMAVSHISAETHGGARIEADVSNYYRVSADGLIEYFANFHDTVPFAPVMSRSDQ